MFFEGPRDLLKDVQAKALTFISRMIKSPKALFGIYAVQQKMEESGARGGNEMLLFHGIAENNCEAINHKDFNRSYCWQKN